MFRNSSSTSCYTFQDSPDHCVKMHSINIKHNFSSSILSMGQCKDAREEVSHRDAPESFHSLEWGLR